jgi:amino acid adenylation domain-containing protein
MSKNRRPDIEAIYELTPLQEGMLFHTLLDDGSSSYFEQLSCRIAGKLDVEAFKSAWQKVVDHHQIFRTSFSFKKTEKLLQVIQKNVPFELNYIDWPEKPGESIKHELENFVIEDRKKPLNLNKAPLMRVSLIKTANESFYFVWSHHHIIIDGWSRSIILRDLFTAYDSFIKNQNIQLPPVRPFGDYIKWIKELDENKAENFWRNYLKGFHSPTTLPNGKMSSSGLTGEFEAKNLQYVLDKRFSYDLNEFARTNGLTLSQILMAAWTLLLHHYNQSDDVVIGLTVSGRPPELAGSEQMSGLFINSVPVRSRSENNITLLSYIKYLSGQSVELREYEHSSLIKIKEWSEFSKTAPLFETLYVFENFPIDESVNKALATLSLSEIKTYSRTNIPLVFVSLPAEEIPIEINYDPSRFSKASVERMLGHIKTILEKFVYQPGLNISELSVLSEEEKNQIFNLWRNEVKDATENPNITRLLKEKFIEFHHLPAAKYNSIELKYSELDEKSNQLANTLIKKGIKPDQLIGICLDRSIEMIISVLAVWKSGAAYLPLDPSYPTERIEYMLADSQSQLLITSEKYLNAFQSFQGERLIVDLNTFDLSFENKTEQIVKIEPDNLCYVIYTSGSTGKPKGAAITHRGAVNLGLNQVKFFKADKNRLMQLASFSFDAWISEFLLSLLTGSTFIITDDEVIKSPEMLTEKIKSEKVDALVITPSVLSLLNPAEFAGIKLIISAGEKLNPELAAKWKKVERFINGYGPTEASVCTSVYECSGHEIEMQIGKPIDNFNTYVLNSNLQPLPVGIPGELYIESIGLARCYLNNPYLTAERFIPNPFSEISGSRLYKSGDLVKLSEDGNLIFLGRIDKQIKLRGLRIELEEIEAVIKSFEEVKNAAVILVEPDHRDAFIAAYISVRSDKYNLPELKSNLQKKLPLHMLPSVIKVIEAIPMTPNGKIDYKALPPIEDASEAVREAQSKNQIEDLLASIWQKILGVSKVNLHDDFFALGGHSIKATQMLTRIREAFNVEIPLKDVFLFPTLKQLSSRINEKLNLDSSESINKIEKRGPDRNKPLPLSLSQQRLWFLDQLSPGNNFFNVVASIRLDGKMDIIAIKKSINSIIQRHEALRTTFHEIEGEAIQVVADYYNFEPETIDLTDRLEKNANDFISKFVNEFVGKPFDLTNLPLFRLLVIKQTSTDWIIVLCMHHIISDGWSIGLFINELSAFYNREKNNTELTLEPIEIQYADFGIWQRENLDLQKHISFWKEEFKDETPVLELPFDRPRPAVQSFNGSTVKTELPAAIMKKVIDLSLQNGATPYITFLSVYLLLLHKFSSQDTIVVGTPNANRRISETEKLIGFFVNTLLVKADFNPGMKFNELVKQVRLKVLQAYAHQDLPFEKLVEVLQPEREMSHSPLFQAAFVYQNIPIEKINFADCEIQPFEIDQHIARYDLTLTLAEVDDSLKGFWEFNVDLFDRVTIERMVSHFNLLLELVISNPAIMLDTMNLLTEEDNKLLSSLNETAADYPESLTADKAFEQIVNRYPSEPAVSYFGLEPHQNENVLLSYLQLNQRSNQLANYLLRFKTKPEEFVAIMLERSIEMVVSVIATLKAGCAFIPVDPSYPRDRIDFMIQDSGARILITSSKIKNQFTSQVDVVIIIDDDLEKISLESTENVQVLIHPEQLSYVIYTSGSTGKPKGAMLTHRGIINLSVSQKKAFEPGPGSRILQFASFSFDASVWEIVMALLSGAEINVVDKDIVSSADNLTKHLKAHGITHITLPPSMISVIEKDEIPKLKVLIAAGEKCSQSLIKRWGTGRKFFNAYGPTETTVCASMYLCNPEDLNDPPIGKPLSNFNLYVLDKNLNPVPIGVKGELFISGIGLSRGYVHQSSLTAERFLPDPFSSHSGARMYRSGDIVKVLPEGNIDFIGRTDSQIKLRGFRIEIAEIESVLSQHPDIVECAVILQTIGKSQKVLTAYYQSLKSDITEKDLQNYLSNELPNYMVPSVFIKLEKLPVSPSGKIDRKALPAPESYHLNRQEEFILPRNEIEEELVRICSEILELDKVSVNANFFEMGGHSLLATQFNSKIKSKFQMDIPLKQIFETPTIEGLANYIKTHEKSEGSDTIEKVDRGQIDLNDLINEIENLSEEEIKKILNSDTK